MQPSAWGAPAWGGGSAASSDRHKLPKGSEPCHICAEDIMVEIKLQPCGHAICLDCTNTMRKNVVFKPDAGLKCPYCREFVDGFTDMKGKPNTIPDLVEANRAAMKSRAARKSGAEKTVSTSVPDPQRLVPPVAPRPAASQQQAAAAAASEPSWPCPQCRHVNAGTKTECTRCGATHPAHVRPDGSKDVLSCSDEDIIKAACERHHPGLNKAFLEAGTPWSNGSIGGTSESVRRALRSKGHERLMRVVHALTSRDAAAERVAQDFHGNYALQNVLEAAHKLRVEALELSKQKSLPAETFAHLPSSASNLTAMRAFSQVLKVLTPLMHRLALSDRGVFVLLKLVKLGSPPEVVFIAEQVTPHLSELVGNKDGTLFLCQLVERLSTIAFEANPTSAKAADSLAAMCAQLTQQHRVLMQSAKHQFLSVAMSEMIQGALPHSEAFKAGYQLAINAGYLSQTRNGANTLELLTELKAADLNCREQIRDIGCYMAKSLQGSFGQLAVRNQQGGQRLVRGLVSLLAREREDDWVREITQEVVGAAADLRGDRDALELLCHCLALPLWSALEQQQHWAALADTPLDSAAMRQQVQAAKVGQGAPAARLHGAVCEVQPSSPPEVLRRFPRLLRDPAAAQQLRHSMLKRSAPPQAPSAAASSSAPSAAVPPTPPLHQQQQQKSAAPPGFSANSASQATAAGGAGAGAGAAAAAAGSKPTPPGFSGSAAGGAAGAAGAVPNGITFPDGTRVPMPQPYNAASSSQAPPSRAPASAPAAAASSAGPSGAREQAAAASSSAGASSSGASSSAAPAAAAAQAAPAPSLASAPPQQPQQAQQQPALPSTSISAAPFVPRMQQQPPPLSAPAAPAAAAAPPPAAPQPTLLPPAPRPATVPQPMQVLPPHLQGLPPHLQQQQRQAASGMSMGGMPGAMPAPVTPLPPQHTAAPYVPQQQQQQQRQQQALPPPQPAQLLPHMFGAAAPPAAAPPTMLPQQPLQAAPAVAMHQQQAPQQPAGPAAAPVGAGASSSSDAFGGFNTLTEMLAELTSTAAAPPQPVATLRPAAPVYRPPYRPAYRPPTAATPAPAAFNPSAPAFNPGGSAAAPAAPAPAAPRAPSPAARFPMPAAPRPAPAAAPAAPQPTQQYAAAAAAVAPPAAGGAPWDCKLCSYHHEGSEAAFLCCAMCGTPQS